MAFDVVSVGSATLDIFVQSPDFKVMPSQEGVVLCEAYGAKLEVDQLVMASGGGATNTAVSFGKLGLHAGLIAEIGKDVPGAAVLADLERFDVSTEMVVKEQSEHTATSIVLVAPEGGRSIVTYRGASRMLDVSDIPWDRLETKWLYLSSLGGRIEVVEALVRWAKERHVKVAINPGAGELKYTDQLKMLLKEVTVVILNDEELAHVTGTDITDENVKDVARGLCDSIVVITQGPKGAHVFTANDHFYCPPSNRPPIETTGAGDAFGSGLITGLIKEWQIEQACQLAIVNAVGVISQVGAKAGLIALDEFESMVQKPEIERK